MPARDIVDLAEDMIDTLVDEGVDRDTAGETTEAALTLYLAPTLALMMGTGRGLREIEQDAQVAASLAVSHARTRQQIRGVNQEPQPPPSTHQLLEGTHSSDCINCSMDSLVRVWSCDMEGCDCFGFHLDESCRHCHISRDLTPREYLPHASRHLMHNWRYIPRSARSAGNRYDTRTHYVYECVDCQMIATSMVDDVLGVLNYSREYSTHCDRSRLVVPRDGSTMQYHSSLVVRFTRGEPGRVIVADQVASRAAAIVRPTRFEREDPI
jgi:hypothetical protein